MTQPETSLCHTRASEAFSAVLLAQSAVTSQSRTRSNAQQPQDPRTQQRSEARDHVNLPRDRQSQLRKDPHGGGFGVNVLVVRLCSFVLLLG